MFQDLGQAVSGFSLRCAWIEGPVARGADRAEDTLVVGVLVEPGDVESVQTSLWGALLRVQSAHDLTLELRVYTLADLETLDARRRGELEGVLTLLGPMPLDVMGAGTRRGAALGPGARATRLRQSSPFLAVLPPEDRRAVLAAARQ